MPTPPTRSPRIEALRERCEALAGRIFRDAVPLTVSVFQCLDRRPLAAVVDAPFTPVDIGWQWGPAWSSAWFRVHGVVPAAMRSESVVLRFDTGTEALLWDGGVPRHGFDANRDACVLWDAAAGGESVNVLIEAACNHTLGTGWFFWDKPEVEARWSTPTPGRLSRCELAVRDDDAWRAGHTARFLLNLAEHLPDPSPRRDAILCGIEAALARVDDDPAAILARLQPLIPGEHPSSKTRCIAVGHAHLDTAWMWPLAETRRKALRTFSNALRLMERWPDFTFLCTQPQQYAWVREDSPALYQQIKQCVRQGRWEPLGAMWVEPDGNLPGGESFVRQILHGTRWLEQAFGEQGRQRLAYLPDTFGFAASLPQIFRLAGLDTFITNKLWWNERNEFPHINFIWRGIDGTEILSHLTPGQEYNATNTPFELRRGQAIAERKDDTGVGIWLQPFGFGDGGGGPTDWTILNAELAAACECVPNTRLSGARAFCEAIHKRTMELREAGTPLPICDGELYLERHRGTYTTQARVKRGNALAEANLRIAEWLTTCSTIVRATGRGTERPVRTTLDPPAHARLHDAWQRTLLNQFHDILPGSSIGEVYGDAAADHAEILSACADIEQEAIEDICRGCDTTGMSNPIAVFNPGSSPRSQWVEWQEGGSTRGIYVKDIPPLGVQLIDREGGLSARCHISDPPTDPLTLTNDRITATIDHTGRITSLRAHGGEELAAEPLNQLALYPDHPQHWEAWDLDADAMDHPQLLKSAADSVEPITIGAGRPAIRVQRSLGAASSITQIFSLSPGSPRLDIDTHIDWHESRTLLRVLFPTTVQADTATYEIPFGHLARSTRRDSPIEQSRFEVSGHRWMDLSQPGKGLALLNDFKYGHSCRGGVLGLSLLRSSKWPDPVADMGPHQFRYSLLPHDGDWRKAGVDKEGELMVRGVWAVPLHQDQRGQLPDRWCPFEVSCAGGASVRIAALKRAEDGKGWIVRCVECHGRSGTCTLRWNFTVTSVRAVDLLERPMAMPSLAHSVGCTTFELGSFQIVTLNVE